MTRNTYILLGVLVALVAAAYLVMQKPGERSSSGGGGESLVAFDSLSIDQIEIKSPTGRVALQKKGVEWFVVTPVSYKADQANVASFIHSAKSLRVDNIVSDKPEKHSVFQVDSTGTIVRILQNGNEKASFVLGKPGSSFTEVYARRSASNEVALVSGASSYEFNRPLRDWRDRIIFAAPKESIREVRYQYGDTTFVLALKDSAWAIGNEKVQDGIANTLLSSLSHLEADDFVDTLSLRPSKPSAQITLSGTQVTFFLVKGNDKYLVQCSASPQWFEMQTWRANQILMRKKDILKSGS
jgi:hypothetical protein